MRCVILRGSFARMCRFHAFVGSLVGGWTRRHTPSSSQLKGVYRFFRKETSACVCPRHVRYPPRSVEVSSLERTCGTVFAVL